MAGAVCEEHEAHQVRLGYDVSLARGQVAADARRGHRRRRRRDLQQKIVDASAASVVKE